MLPIHIKTLLVDNQINQNDQLESKRRDNKNATERDMQANTTK